MRSDNLLIIVLGLSAFWFAVFAIVRWGGLPVRAPVPDPAVERPPARVALFEAVGSLAAVFSAALVSGLLIAGPFARVIMRIAGAVSPVEAQGRLTEADEVVGEITLGGTFFLVVFVGLFGAVVALALYLLARPWLPATARVAGGIVGLLVMGLLGPGDPLDPDNIDFALLSFDTLTVVLIIAGSVLFGMAFASLVARFDVLIRSGTRARWLLTGGFLLCLLGPLAVASLVYLGGRTLLPGRLRVILDLRPVQVVGRAVVMLAVLASVVRIGLVAIDIIRS